VPHALDLQAGIAPVVSLIGADISGSLAYAMNPVVPERALSPAGGFQGGRHAAAGLPDHGRDVRVHSRDRCCCSKRAGIYRDEITIPIEPAP
jgi:hypothetical protein